MAILVNHGGGCCGARHIYNFRASEEDDIRDLEQILADEQASVLYEVILSELQCRSKPLVLERLDTLGFVLTDRWTGNHGTAVNRFSRTRQRLPLEGETRTYGWTGMLANPALYGRLPAAAAAAGHLRAGVRCRVTNRQSANFGQEVRIEEVRAGHYYGTRRGSFRDPVTGEMRDLAESSLEILGEAVPPARHNNAPVVQGAAVREIVTLYRSVFADGREGSFHETLESCQRAAPRCRRRQRVVFKSDGTRDIEEV